MAEQIIDFGFLNWKMNNAACVTPVVLFPSQPQGSLCLWGQSMVRRMVPGMSEVRSNHGPQHFLNLRFHKGTVNPELRSCSTDSLEFLPRNTRISECTKHVWKSFPQPLHNPCESVSFASMCGWSLRPCPLRSHCGSISVFGLITTDGRRCGFPIRDAGSGAKTKTTRLRLADGWFENENRRSEALSRASACQRGARHRSVFGICRCGPRCPQTGRGR